MTDFLDTLTAVRETDPASRVVEHFLANVKTIPRRARTPLGFIEDAPGVRLYYWQVDGGVLEVETRDVDGKITRRVTDFITAAADLDEMLGVARESLPH